MPLINCPDCGKQVSSEAPTCLGCGRPIKQTIFQAPAILGAGLCPYCKAQAVGKVRGLQGIGEVCIAAILVLAFLRFRQ